MIKKNGKIYLIPTTLGEYNFEHVLPNNIKNIINNLHYYIVENIRTTRRFLAAYKSNIPIDELTFFELNKHTDRNQIAEYLKPVLNGFDLGIQSEAGLPGIADPGNIIVKLAHANNIRVVPLTGPSSILLGLIASGFNGQNFAFNGYLPIQKQERTAKIKTMEQKVLTENQTQIFMETPYRNQKLLDDLMHALSPQTNLCIACDITLETEFIQTQTIENWRKKTPDINKRPTIFAIGNE